MEKQSNQNRNYFIYLAVFSVNLIAFATGACFSWASPVLPKLSNTDPSINPLTRPTTTFQDSWIASLLNLGAAVGPFAAGYCSDKLGRKKTLLVFGVPMVLAHLLCAFAQNVHFFLVARFVLGIACGCVFSVLPNYVGEIAEDSNRGVLGCIFGIMCNGGILFSYIVGPFVSIRTLSFINLIPIALFYITFGYFIPESPYYLMSIQEKSKAEESLRKLRNKPLSQIEKELLYISETVGDCQQPKATIFDLFKSKGLTRAMVISNCLMVFQQLSGIGAVLGYMQSIFDATGSFIPASYSVIIIGTVQWMASAMTSQLVDRLGRKILLVSSNMLSCLSLVALGAYFYLKNTFAYSVDQISWLPILSLVVYIIGYNLGLSTLPWVVMGELFPSNVKSMASTLTTSLCLTLGFLITMCFPFLNEMLGMAGSFWLFGVVMACGGVFCMLVVPETKGKSLQEIQAMLNDLVK